MDEWTDSVRIAVDIFVACVIISALLLCMTLGNKISNYMDLQHAAAAKRFFQRGQRHLRNGEKAGSRFAACAGQTILVVLPFAAGLGLRGSGHLRKIECACFS